MSSAALEKTWTHAGLDCAVLATSAGHRCGYVRIPEGHPWHGVSYHDAVPGAKVDRERPIEGQAIAALIYAAKPDAEHAAGDPLDILVSVHGGLTFSGTHSRLPEGWWVGFDCAHAGDGKDRALMDEASLRFHEQWGFDEGDVWRLPDVVTETEHLADQVAAQRGAFEVKP